MSEEKTIVISINGVEEHVSDVILLSLLKRKGFDLKSRGVAVAVQDQLARKRDWSEFHLKNGDRVEIITAAQGG